MPLDTTTYLEILKEKYWVFTAGKYPQGEFTAKDIKQIASNYDPDFCEAPLWVGHPNPENEPEALAWIGKVFAEGDQLLVQFSYISDELVYMIERKRFKRVSIELWKFEEKPGWYLYAVGLTNRPQVKNLKPIEFMHSGVKNLTFSTERVVAKASLNTVCHLAFSEDNKNRLIQKSNKTEMKIEDIKKFAADRKIEIPEGATEQEVVSKVFSYVDDQVNQLSEANKKIAKFNDTTKTLEEQITELKSKEVDLVVEFGINAKRIVGEQKEFYKKFGIDNGADKLKELVNTLPVQTLFAQDKVNGAEPGKSGSAKFKNADGSDLTYSDYLKKSLENPKFSDNFTEEEVKKLKEDTW